MLNSYFFPFQLKFLRLQNSVGLKIMESAQANCNMNTHRLQHIIKKYECTFPYAIISVAY